MKQRIRVVQGGTSASKTISILLYLIHLAQSDKTPTLTSIVSESFPHLKRGAIKDFLLILNEHKYFKEDRWNRTDSTYSFETGSKIEFFSVDQPGKVRGPRRDRLFLNEANNVPYESFDQLEVRTKDLVYIDFNPVADFWVFDQVLNRRSDAEKITLTYKDNEALSPEIRASIEQRKDNKGWWQVYGLGQLGEVEGKIYKDWQIIDDIPHEAKLISRGLDFGYSNDPTAVVDIYRYNGGYIFDEQLYQKGLSNKQIADILLQLPPILMRADSAEPKSIDELKMYGVSVLPATKGPGSVNQGIQNIQDKRVSVTKRSVNLIKEYRNYLWQTDKDGKILNAPIDIWNHCFAPKSLVHTVEGEIPIKDLVGKEGFLISRDGLIKRFYDVRETRKNVETAIVEFTDKTSIEVTPDHLLLSEDGTWIEAGLLCPSDRIQSVMYGNYSFRQKAGISISSLHQVLWGKILQGFRSSLCKTGLSASRSVEISQWGNSKGFSYSSQRWEQGQQPNSKPRVETQDGAFERTHDSREKGETKEMGGYNQTANKKMAPVKEGKGMAQGSWRGSFQEKKTDRKGLRSLSFGFFYSAIRKISKVLSSKLQNESPSKTVKGITRGFQEVTYNLEVEDTHCLLVDGVIAHNCLDACRYGMPLDFFMTDEKRDEMAFERTMRDKRLRKQKKGSILKMC